MYRDGIPVKTMRVCEPLDQSNVEVYGYTMCLNPKLGGECVKESQGQIVELFMQTR